MRLSNYFRRVMRSQNELRPARMVLVAVLGGLSVLLFALPFSGSVPIPSCFPDYGYAPPSPPSPFEIPSATLWSLVALATLLSGLLVVRVGRRGRRSLPQQGP